MLLLVGMGLASASSNFDYKQEAPWEEGYQPGVFEGLHFENDHIKRLEKGYKRTIDYGIILSREYVFGNSYNVFFNQEKNELVVEFGDMKLGESELATEYSYPIVSMEFDEYIVDQNQLLSGTESEFKYVTSIKFTFDEKVDYKVNINEFNELKISLSHQLPLEDFAEPAQTEEHALSKFKNWIKDAVKMAKLKSLR